MCPRISFKKDLEKTSKGLPKYVKVFFKYLKLLGTSTILSKYQPMFTIINVRMIRKICIALLFTFILSRKLIFSKTGLSKSLRAIIRPLYNPHIKKCSSGPCHIPTRRKTAIFAMQAGIDFAKCFGQDAQEAG